MAENKQSTLKVVHNDLNMKTSPHYTKSKRNKSANKISGGRIKYWLFGSLRKRRWWKTCWKLFFFFQSRRAFNVEIWFDFLSRLPSSKNTFSLRERESGKAICVAFSEAASGEMRKKSKLWWRHSTSLWMRGETINHQRARRVIKISVKPHERGPRINN